MEWEINAARGSSRNLTARFSALASLTSVTDQHLSFLHLHLAKHNRNSRKFLRYLKQSTRSKWHKTSHPCTKLQQVRNGHLHYPQDIDQCTQIPPLYTHHQTRFHPISIAQGLWPPTDPLSLPWFLPYTCSVLHYWHSPDATNSSPTWVAHSPFESCAKIPLLSLMQVHWTLTLF